MRASIGVNLRVTGHCRQGGRKYMEDYFSVAYQQTRDEKDLEYAFFGIYDGHGGAEAAAYAKEHLMENIVSHPSFWSDDDDEVLRAIREGYIATHMAMWKDHETWPKTASGLNSTAGTTASVAFIRRGKIYIGHVGDSGIVLGYEEPGSPEWKARPLTVDHKPESDREILRIQRCGGKVVVKSGVPRVVWNRPRIGHKGPVRRSTPIDEIPFLAVARSLGDLWSYNYKLDEFVVSPDPDVSVHLIDPNTFRCLVFGTDGLYNMVSAQMAVHVVQQVERHNEAVSLSDELQKYWMNPSRCLVEKALERWNSTKMRADNTSVVTLMLDPPGPPRAQVLRERKRKYQESGLEITTRYEEVDNDTDRYLHGKLMTGYVTETGSGTKQSGLTVPNPLPSPLQHYESTTHMVPKYSPEVCPPATFHATTESTTLMPNDHLIEDDSRTNDEYNDLDGIPIESKNSFDGHTMEQFFRRRLQQQHDATTDVGDDNNKEDSDESSIEPQTVASMPADPIDADEETVSTCIDTDSGSVDNVATCSHIESDYQLKADDDEAVVDNSGSESVDIQINEVSSSESDESCSSESLDVTITDPDQTCDAIEEASTSVVQSESSNTCEDNVVIIQSVHEPDAAVLMQNPPSRRSASRIAVSIIAEADRRKMGARQPVPIVILSDVCDSSNRRRSNRNGNSSASLISVNPTKFIKHSAFNRTSSSAKSFVSTTPNSCSTAQLTTQQYHTTSPRILRERKNTAADNNTSISASGSATVTTTVQPNQNTQKATSGAHEQVSMSANTANSKILCRVRSGIKRKLNTVGSNTLHFLRSAGTGGGGGSSLQTGSSVSSTSSRSTSNNRRTVQTTSNSSSSASAMSSTIYKTLTPTRSGSNRRTWSQRQDEQRVTPTRNETATPSPPNNNRRANSDASTNNIVLRRSVNANRRTTTTGPPAALTTLPNKSSQLALDKENRSAAVTTSSRTTRSSQFGGVAAQLGGVETVGGAASKTKSVVTSTTAAVPSRSASLRSNSGVAAASMAVGNTVSNRFRGNLVNRFKLHKKSLKAKLRPKSRMARFSKIREKLRDDGDLKATSSELFPEHHQAQSTTTSVAIRSSGRRSGQPARQ